MILIFTICCSKGTQYLRMAMFNKLGIESLQSRPFCPGNIDLRENIARFIT